MLDQFYDPKWLVKITARDQSFASSLEWRRRGIWTTNIAPTTDFIWSNKLYTVRAEG